MKGVTRSRAGLGRLGRALSVLRNYGFSSHRMEESMDSFRRFLRDNGCPATFTCPSTLLHRSQELVDFLREFNVAIHGKEHIDYRNAMTERIESDLHKAISDFESVGLKPRGFRAPYLRWNKELVRAVAGSGLKYDSSTSIFWDVGRIDLGSRAEVANVLDFYSSKYEENTPSLPRMEEGIVRLPVSLPDDEILIERLAMAHPKDLFACWLEMLDKSYRRSELLVMQIHPERFSLCEEALGLLLKEVRKRNIWTSTLEEIASWWIERSRAEVIVDEDGRVHCDGPHDLVVGVQNETRTQDERVSAEHLVRISPDHPLHERARELGFVVTRNPLAFPIDRDLSQERELIEAARSNNLLHKGFWPHGHQSAFCLTGDIDALSVGDFFRRRSTWRPRRSGRDHR